ncbi:MAG TPA: gliding motility protein GldM, partial [Bacteroidales bacterium]|nr:gliding motility protein GldM [Bacteroidales bacterium]
MAGFRETPRQKMIGMLYLVLLALLALNVSVDVLDAFVTVNESMEATNENFSRKIEATYYAFEQQNIINPARVGPFFEKAIQVREMSNELISFINEMIIGAIARSEEVDPEEAKVLSLREARTKSSYDRTTTFFINEGRASIIRERIEEYRENVLNLLDPVERERIKIGLDTEGPFYDRSGNRQDWETHNFYHTILAANVTILNKIINEVQNAEFDIVNHLFASVDADSYRFDAIEAKVIPSSNFVFLGETYEAEILVAAYDTKSNPEVLFVDGAERITEQNLRNARRIEGRDGSVKIRIPTNSEGVKRYAGAIQVPDPSGVMRSYNFSHQFIVGRPSVTVSATKMNVFYTGVDNPVSISVSGMADTQIQPSISAGEIRRVGNEWIVRVPETASTAVITVKAEGRDMGSSEFRVKRVPDPTATIAGISGGQIARNRLIAAAAIIPTMPADFEFDLTFRISSFNFVAARAGEIFQRPGSGNRLTDEMINYIQNARRGD